MTQTSLVTNTAAL